MEAFDFDIFHSPLRSTRDNLGLLKKEIEP